MNSIPLLYIQDCTPLSPDHTNMTGFSTEAWSIKPLWQLSPDVNSWVPAESRRRRTYVRLENSVVCFCAMAVCDLWSKAETSKSSDLLENLISIDWLHLCQCFLSVIHCRERKHGSWLILWRIKKNNCYIFSFLWKQSSVFGSVGR